MLGDSSDLNQFRVKWIVILLHERSHLQFITSEGLLWKNSKSLLEQAAIAKKQRV